MLEKSSKTHLPLGQSWNPNGAHIDRHFREGAALQAAGKLDAAIAAFREALALDPDLPATHYNLGAALQTAGRLEEAAGCYRKTLALKPDHARAHANLGTVLHDQGRIAEAIASYRQALALKPKSPGILYNLGNALRTQGDLAGAVASYDEAVAQQPGFVSAHNNLGTALQEAGRLDDAISTFRRALALEPRASFLHYNLGRALEDQGELEAAIASCREAISLKPDYAEAHYALGRIFQSRGALDAAAECYRKAVASNPGYAEAHNNLGDVLNQVGQAEEALACCRRALEFKEEPEFTANFVRCLKRANPERIDAASRSLAARAVAGTWARAGDLAVIASSLIAAQPEVRAALARASSAWPARSSIQALFGSSGLATLARDPLLRVLLESCPVCDLALERLLTNVRRDLLAAAVADGKLAEVQTGTLELCCALARQCFINEYVFSVTDEELQQATALRERVELALTSGAPIDPLHVVAVAAYLPLHALSRCGALLERSWPAAVAKVLTQQIEEPAEERRCRGAMPVLTPVEDAVSLEVQRQYEENPYPRWVGVAHPGRPLPVNAYLRRHFPFARFEPLDLRGPVDILVAGCGTGREPIDMARQFAGARVLAVDLSLSSLCYAKRKTRELGVSNVEYAQADIMKLGSIGRTFDVIDSVGVLHHLGDPVAGWRELLALLRPGGLMLIGLYSETARHDIGRIVAAREFIRQRGYAPTASDIRRCREDLAAADGGRAFAPLIRFSDFYTVSECRDLLFHVQEHRFTLPQIKAALGELGLRFVSFSLESDVFGQYRRRFPGDAALTDLDRWHEFETGSFSPFLGMYVFWVQKAR
jgi:tetratricopeptide (TPR) repeat protein/SAM-dependent methyltransferase